jgi:tRNA A37 threonylcarbamoyladenosine modification protein TsaB
MNTLIIDATRHNFLKAFLCKDKKIFKDFSYEGRDIFSSLNSTFKSIPNIDIIGINKGPGSFTRTKVSLAYTKGYCYGKGVPLIAISSFDVLKKDKKNLIVDAGRGKVYIKDDSGYRVEVGSNFEEIDYNTFLSIILSRFEKKKFDDPLKVLPLYISEI